MNDQTTTQIPSSPSPHDLPFLYLHVGSMGLTSD